MTSTAPSVWGPQFWNVMHLVALGYPSAPTEDERVQYKRFYEAFGQVVPCGKCRDEYQEHIRTLPLTMQALSTPDSLFAWTVQVHNAVNASTGKKSTWTAEQAKTYYLSGRYNKCNARASNTLPTEEWRLLLIMMIGFNVIVATYLLWKLCVDGIQK